MTVKVTQNFYYIKLPPYFYDIKSRFSRVRRILKMETSLKTLQNHHTSMRWLLLLLKHHVVVPTLWGLCQSAKKLQPVSHAPSTS